LIEGETKSLSQPRTGFVNRSWLIS